MKTARLLLPLSLVLAALRLVAAPVDSRITSVTVYQDRAVVTRTATVQLGGGTTELVFANLPQSLNEQSLQVSGRGAAQATILDVSAKQTFIDYTPNARVKELEDQLRALGKQTRGIDDRQNLLNASSATLERMEGALFAPPAKDVPRPDLNQFTASLTYLSEQKARLTAERATLDEQREDLQNKISTVQNQLNELRGAGGKAFKTVTVRVAAAQSGSLDVSLAYTVPGASWVPSYDARLASAERTVQLDYFGIVRQGTGEDWKDVALTLSTARPSLGGAAPVLSVWQLDVYVPRPMPMAAAAPSFDDSSRKERGYAKATTLAGNRLNTELRDVGDAVSVVTQEFISDIAAATIEAGATSASFKIAVSSSVASDNSPQKVPITSASLKAVPEYLSVPKRQAAAFLTSKVVNTSDFPLLSGAMNVFLDGTFVATSGLRTVMAGEKFDLALGVDDGIAIKHKRVNKFTEDTGLTNSGKRITYEYLITVQNNKKTTERVIVADQVPLSRNEKVVVKLLSPDAKDVKPSDEGTLKWTLDLKPGEKRELTVKFTVEHDNNVNVMGLE
jgi:uncharacterized protein (TIGR02231 family)